jgi:hypothetical protein
MFRKKKRLAGCGLRKKAGYQWLPGYKMAVWLQAYKMAAWPQDDRLDTRWLSGYRMTAGYKIAAWLQDGCLASK